MQEYVESVKRAIELIQRSADTLREKTPDKASERDEMANGIIAAMSELERLKVLTTALPPDLGNIFDLPQELIEELAAAKTDELEDQLVTVINACGKEASLDQILVGLYRKFKVIQKRRFLQNKLYRMEMVWSVDGKKGLYTTVKPTDPIQNVDAPQDFDIQHSPDWSTEEEVPF